MDMKASELMIGDWVFVDKYFTQKYHKVRSLSIEEGIGGIYVNDYGVECKSALVSDTIKPIPLTEEIFRENCFDIVQDGDALTIWKQKDDEYGNEIYDITIYEFEGVPCYDTSIRCHGAIRKNIYYVHELQQALRLCRLNELADNFKIV